MSAQVQPVVERGTDPAEPVIRAVRLTAAQWPEVRPSWCELLSLASKSSFFMTPEWVDAWLDVYGQGMNVEVLAFESGSDRVGACLLVRGEPWCGIVPLRRISLNASGEDYRETAFIELNQLLCRAGWEERVAAALTARLTHEKWDELALDGFSGGPDYEALKSAFSEYRLEERWQPSYYVDLAALRRSGSNYADALSSRCRAHLRQSVRHYSKLGDLRLEPAHDVETALAMFDELGRLNRARFSGRKRRSVFDSPRFRAFHHRLIRSSFPQRSIQLLRLKVGERTLGVTYSLLHHGKACLYQTGFDYTVEKRLSPGRVTLAHAIQFCLEQGLDDWDFLSGDQDYKRLLSSGERRLVWTVVRRQGLRTGLAGAMRAAGRSIERFLRRDGAPVVVRAGGAGNRK